MNPKIVLNLRIISHHHIIIIILFFLCLALKLSNPLTATIFNVATASSQKGHAMKLIEPNICYKLPSKLGIGVKILFLESCGYM